ncbi:Vitamin B12 transporter BtuB precursor [compost metagenome]
MPRHRPLLPLSALSLLLVSLPALAQGETPSPPETVHHLDEIVVTGTRTERRMADAPVATEVITRREIEASGALNAAQLLSGRMGIEIVPSLGVQGVRLQGLETQHVLIFVDGKRITGRVNGAVDLSRFTVDTLERIEIVRGGSSALYGSEAMGGVINLITRSAEKTASFEGQAGYGNSNAAVLSGSLATRLGSVNHRLAVDWRRRDAFDLTPDTVGTSGNSYEQLTLDDRSEFKLNEHVRLKSSVDYLRRNQTGIDSSATGAIFDRQNLTETFSAGLEPEFRLPGFERLRVSAYYNLYRDQFLQDQRGASALDQVQQTRDQLAQLNVQDERALGMAHVLTTGAELAYERLDTERLQSAFGDRVRAALYLQDEWEALEAPRLMIVPGLRADADSRFGTHVAPKLALRLDPMDSLTLRASVGTGFRAPDFKELMLRFINPAINYEILGNPDLRPETSMSYNLGLEARPTPWAWLGLNLYLNDVSNLIDAQLRPDDGTSSYTQYQYLNIASAMTRGIESSLRLNVLPGLVLEPGYTLNDTLNRTENRPLPGRALHSGSLIARYDHEGLGLGGYAKLALVGERPFSESRSTVTEVTMAPAYTTLDMKITKVLTREISLFLQGDNLLNASDPAYLPIPRRSARWRA